MSFSNQTNKVGPDDIEANVPQAVVVMDKHQSWKSDTSSVSAASKVSQHMLHYGVGKTMAKKAKERVESGKWPGHFAVCFMFTFGLVALSVLLPIVGVISAVVGRAFVENQVLGTPFPDEVGLDLGYVVGQFVVMGLACCGVIIACIVLGFTSCTLIKNDKVPCVFNCVLAPGCMLCGAGLLVLPPLVVAKIIADTFGVRLKGVFIFLLVASAMELLKDAGLSCLCGGGGSKSKKKCEKLSVESNNIIDESFPPFSSSTPAPTDNNIGNQVKTKCKLKSNADKDDDKDSDEWCILGCAWRSLASYVAYIAATNGGHLPTIVNGQGLAAVLGAVGGTFLVPVFMAFQLQAQAILGQDTGNSTVPFFT